jgi:hypothetical protein
MPSVANANAAAALPAVSSSNEACRQCGTSGVPLLACDDPEAMQAHPGPNKPKYVKK